MENKAIHPVDVFVGKRLKERRILLKVSQEQLAELIDITFQQIQKYEKGYNRISSSKLYEIANALKTTVSYFFEGIQPQEIPYLTNEYIYSSNSATLSCNDVNELDLFLISDNELNAEISELVTYYSQISQKGIRQNLLQLVKSIIRT